MKLQHTDLEKIQDLVIDIIKVERNHTIPGTNRHENVVEHSFSLAMFCFKIFETIKPSLDIEKILKYALVHDFLERGQGFDINTFAKAGERETKKLREKDELKKIEEEFSDFPSLIEVLNDYENNIDEEALFVWSVDKIQGIVSGKVDNWRPYISYKVSYEDFCKKYEELILKCHPSVRDIFRDVFEDGKKTYYEQPKN